MAHLAPGSCLTCGFFVRLGGPLGQVFGVCANSYAPDDGRVVSADHGCGAHSEALPPPGSASARRAGDRRARLRPGRRAWRLGGRDGLRVVRARLRLSGRRGTDLRPALRLAGAGTLEVGHVPQREQPHAHPGHAGPDPPPVAGGGLLPQRQDHHQGDRPRHGADDGDPPVVRLERRRGWPSAAPHVPRLACGTPGAVDEMFRIRVLLAKVMTQAKKDDTTAAARGPTLASPPHSGSR